MTALKHEVTTPYEQATFGMGCFWANDALFGAVQGVLRTKVGYASGTSPAPTYKNIGDHTEVIEIHFDPHCITYEDLLKLFWNHHEYGLTANTKIQYRSLILYHNDEQKSIADKSMKLESEKHKERLLTVIAPATVFFPAEESTRTSSVCVPSPSGLSVTTVAIAADYHHKTSHKTIIKRCKLYTDRRNEAAAMATTVTHRPLGKGHSWLAEQICINPHLLQTSWIAARLNGYLVGLGDQDSLDKDIAKMGLTNQMADYLRKHWSENIGGSLYC